MDGFLAFKGTLKFFFLLHPMYVYITEKDFMRIASYCEFRSTTPDASKEALCNPAPNFSFKGLKDL